MRFVDGGPSRDFIDACAGNRARQIIRRPISKLICGLRSGSRVAVCVVQAVLLT